MTEPVVHVVDDDDAMRDSLKFLLESEDMRVETYESAEAFLAAAPTALPGCVLTDVRMPGMSGLDLVRVLKSTKATMSVVVMTGHADVPLAIEAMKLGIADFIEKPFDDVVLLTALKGALQRLSAHAERDDARREIHARLATLSPRETDVLDGLVAGKANKVIAFDLGISPRTVEIYRANLMTKMGVKSLSELVRCKLLADGLTEG